MSDESSAQYPLVATDTPIENGSKIELLPQDFDYAKFGRDFLNQYLTLGFGSLTKKEIELQIFKQLHEADAFRMAHTSRMQQISVSLRIPVSRVRSLMYETQLRSGVATEAWVRKEFLAAIKSSRYRLSSEKVEFGVEDPMLRAAIEGRLKQDGRFADFGMSREILHVAVEDFAFLLKSVLSEAEQKAVIDSIPNLDKKIEEASLFKVAVKEFVTAAASSAGKEVGQSAVRVFFGFLSSGTTEITAHLARLFK